MQNKIFVFECRRHEPYLYVRMEVMGQLKNNMKNHKHPNPTNYHKIASTRNYNTVIMHKRKK